MFVKTGQLHKGEVNVFHSGGCSVSFELPSYLFGKFSHLSWTSPRQKPELQFSASLAVRAQSRSLRKAVLKPGVWKGSCLWDPSFGMHGGGGAQLLLAAMVEPGQCRGVAGASRGSHVGCGSNKGAFSRTAFTMCLHVELLSLATWTLREYCSVAKSCPPVCDPMDCSTPDLPVHCCLLEFTQMHVHGVGDAIQPSHPLSLPSPVLNLS